ncbi:hypothetical protein FB45DRAFT_1027619 [Roridomyces roridus]|uniref:Uncharacterized protein n=1 Tax=Roridomyces roridus TaxID=1738132 RepID=A0AAD7BTD4_9AGAR|nr:hypothetical protein FB45DRAFT_1027619 [Roridomyces roridus]
MAKQRARNRARRIPAPQIPPFPVAMMARLAAAQEEEMSSYRTTLAQLHERERERREQEKRDLEKRNKELPPIPESPFVRPDSQVLVPELWVTNPVSEIRVAQENQSSFENETPSPTPLPKSPRDYRNPFASRENLPDPESQISIKSSISSKRQPQRPYQNMGWLNEQYPHVAPHLILKVVRHQLEPLDVARLDPDRKETVFEHGCFWTDHLTIESLVAPLAIYFRILQSWVSATSRNDDSENLVSQCALAYIAHLHELNEHYEWVFVLQYHVSFHEKQRKLMRRGEYSQWNVVDMDLVGIREQHLLDLTMAFLRIQLSIVYHRRRRRNT